MLVGQYILDLGGVEITLMQIIKAYDALQKQLEEGGNSLCTSNF